MAAMQRTEAYDYRRSNAMPKPAEPSRRRAPAPAPHVVKKTSAQLKSESRKATLKAIKIMIVSALLLTMIGFSIYSRVRLDELDRQLTQINSDTDIIVSENTRLKSEINSRISLDKVEEYAQNELGMVKVENYQIKYIDLDAKDQVVVSGNKSANNKTWLMRFKDYLF